MKKRMIITAIVLSFLTVALELNADMRITPGGVTSPDASGGLHLSGSVTTGNIVPNPNGAVVSGVNSYPDGYYSYGGYFEAAGAYGRGVCGSASGTNGLAVYGYASGSSGRGVYGYASNPGDETNYGGYFTASGKKGRGVRGETTGANSIGVYGIATGENSTGVYGDGVIYDFYAAGPGINYGSFTGGHEVKFSENMPEDIVPGMIVSVTGKTEARKDKNGGISLSSTLPTVTISTRAGDKAVFGVIVSKSPLPEDHWYEAEAGERFGVVNALGEGRVWVTDINGEIRAGDYITTSSVPGYGQMQDDDILHAYTLGKAIETVDFDQVGAIISYNGKKYKAYLLAVVYTSG